MTQCPKPVGDGAAANPSLLAQGWTRRFLADADRAAEAVELYQSMGLEVRAETPSPADLGGGPTPLGESCSGCAETLCRTYRMIYTRKRSP